MKRNSIIFAIIVAIALSAASVTAQPKGNTRGNRQIVGGAGGAGSLAVTKRSHQITVPTGSGNDTFRTAGIKDGTSKTLMNARSRTGRTETVDKNETITINGRSSSRANSITFEGNDEPLWAKRSTSPRQFGNWLTGSDGGVSERRTTVGSSQNVTIGGRTRSLSGDFNGDSDVDAADYVLRSSGQKNNVSGSRRSGVAVGDFNNDYTDTVGFSSPGNGGRPQTLTAGTYGRGRQNSLIGLLIP